MKIADNGPRRLFARLYKDGGAKLTLKNFASNYPTDWLFLNPKETAALRAWFANEGKAPSP